PAVARRVETEIKIVGSSLRIDVVPNLVVVWELNGISHLHSKHRRRKLEVLLIHYFCLWFHQRPLSFDQILWQAFDGNDSTDGGFTVDRDGPFDHARA